MLYNFVVSFMLCLLKIVVQSLVFHEQLVTGCPFVVIVSRSILVVSSFV